MPSALFVPIRFHTFTPQTSIFPTNQPPMEKQPANTFMGSILFLGLVFVVLAMVLAVFSALQGRFSGCRHPDAGRQPSSSRRRLSHICPVKIILSRKGFDSSYGGGASPILPNGDLLSIPIPAGSQETGILYVDLQYGNRSYVSLMNELGSEIAGQWSMSSGPRPHS